MVIASTFLCKRAQRFLAHSCTYPKSAGHTAYCVQEAFPSWASVSQVCSTKPALPSWSQGSWLWPAHIWTTVHRLQAAQALSPSRLPLPVPYWNTCGFAFVVPYIGRKGSTESSLTILQETGWCPVLCSLFDSLKEVVRRKPAILQEWGKLLLAKCIIKAGTAHCHSWRIVPNLSSKRRIPHQIIQTEMVPCILT